MGFLFIWRKIQGHTVWAFIQFYRFLNNSWDIKETPLLWRLNDVIEICDFSQQHVHYTHKLYIANYQSFIVTTITKI